MTKKILAILAAICMLAAVGSIGASADYILGEDNEFHMLVIPDAHQNADEDLNLTAYIASAIKLKADANTPLDLIIFLGDNVVGSATADAAAIRKGVERLLAPVLAAEIPFTLVFGNHDYGDMSNTMKETFSKADLLAIYKEIGGNLFAVPDAEYSSATGGVTNFMYNISQEVPGETEEDEATMKPYAKLFLFDTGSIDADQNGYDYVREDQLSWFAANNDTSVPALVFQHIPVPEIYSGGYFLKTPFNWNLPLSTKYVDTYYYGTANFVKMVGTVLESPCPPYYTDGEFEAMKEAGNVQAMFFGHDHVNNFVEQFDGLDLVQLPGTAWNGSYGSFLVRGGTFVTIRNNPLTGKTYYSSDFFTYRQASRVSDSKVASTVHGFDDFIYVVPFALQNMFAPLRMLFGNW